MQSAREWYQAGVDDQQLALADEAFKKALRIFNDNITKDPRKKCIAKNSISIQELEQVIKIAKSKYEGKHKGRASKWLTRISNRVSYYGNIADVLVQHHPEYVSLAWGAFKFMFVLVENQEVLVGTLAKGLSQVADSLPRMQLATILYPTQRMKEAVAQLYAHIINFFIRAKYWYEESKLRHAINSFIRPAKLRYDDIIQNIELCTKDIDQLSTASARAEQRDIHLELQEFRRRQEETDKESKMVLLEIRKMCISSQSLQSSSFLDTSKRLTDLQLNQIIDNLSRTRKLDPLKSLQFCTYVSSKSTSKNIRKSQAPFWYHPKVNNWRLSKASALIMIKGEYKARQEVKGFAVNLVKLLRQENTPVIWTLKSPHESGTENICTVDVLRDLVCQVLRLNISMHTERRASLSCARFRTAETLDEWFELLETLLDKIPLLYIIIDIESVSVAFANTIEDFSWLASFSNVMEKLSKRSLTTILKVILVSYGSAALQEPKLPPFPDLVVSTRQSIQGISHKRGMGTHLSRRGRRCVK